MRAWLVSIVLHVPLHNNNRGFYFTIHFKSEFLIFIYAIVKVYLVYTNNALENKHYFTIVLYILQIQN